MKKLSLILTAFMFMSCFICSAQKNKNKKGLKIDDWEEVPSNDEYTKSLTGMNRDVPSSNFATNGTVWDHRIITYFFENGTSDIIGVLEETAVHDAFSIWKNVTNLKFMEVCNIADADIVFEWATGGHGDPTDQTCSQGLGVFNSPGGTLAHSLLGPPSTACGNQAGDIHFDDNETWTLSIRSGTSQPLDLVTVALHEIGHSLGLAHTTVEDAVMEAVYLGSRRTLHADDIAGISNLYGNFSTQSNVFISGNELLCNSNATYTLQELPSGSTVTWSVSPMSLFAVDSGTGTTFTTRSTNSSTSGEGTITATISHSCGTAPVTIDRTIWVGAPNYQNIGVGVFQGQGGDYELCEDQSMQLLAATYSNGADIDPEITGFEWSLSDPSVFVQYWNSVGGLPDYTKEGTEVDMTAYYEDLDVSVRAYNSCSNMFSGWHHQTFTTIGCGGFFMTMSPNPSKGELTIAFIKRNTNGILFAKDNHPVRVEIFDHTRSSLLSRNGDTSDFIKIKTTSFSPGKYVVLIYLNNEVYQRHLLIE